MGNDNIHASGKVHLLARNASISLLSWSLQKSQAGWGWKGPLEVNKSNTLAQAGSPGAGCPGPHPCGSWVCF